MGTLFNDIASRVVSAGTTPASTQSKKQIEAKSKNQIDNPFASRNTSTVWGNRTLDDARLAKREEMKKKASFMLGLVSDDKVSDLPQGCTREFNV